MEISVEPKKWYVVSGTAGATVTKPDGTVIATVPDGGQTAFLATTYTVLTSDSKVEVVESTFKYAPAMLLALGLFGRGVTTDLPSGYLPARFLESTRNQFIHIADAHNWTAWSLTTRRTNLDYAGDFRQGYHTDAKKNAEVGVTRSNDSRGAYAAYLNANLYGGGELVGEPNSGLKRFTAGVDTARLVAYLGEQQMPITSSATEYAQFYLFAIFNRGPNIPSYNTLGAVYHFSRSSAESSLSLRPVIDPQGVPCMWDSIGKTGYYAYRSSVPGKFAIGMTAAQARRLLQLPADVEDKTLTVSLPADIVDGETVTDDEVQAALDAAAAKGWDITIQTYTD